MIHQQSNGPSMRGTPALFKTIWIFALTLLSCAAKAGPATSSCQEARLVSPEPAVYDAFGWSVGISGDRAIASAPQVGGITGCGESFPACGGRTFVFRRDGETWVKEAELLPPDGPNYFAARSVGISGDVVVVGAPHVNEIGEVYVFRRSGTNWTLTDRLQASDARPYDYFGWTVAIRGDLIVAASGTSCQSGPNCNEIHVFRLSGGTWNEEAKLTFADICPAGFGMSLAIDEDRIAASLPNPCHTVFVFHFENGKWSLESELVSSGSNDSFGYPLALQLDTMLVGASWEVIPCTCATGCRTGGSFVFLRDGIEWKLAAKLPASNQGLLGTSLALDGNLALIGTSRGAYVFQRSDAGWNQNARLFSTDNLPAFGSPVAIDNGYAIVGAPSAEFAGFWSGAAYIFRVLGNPDIDNNGINDACEGDCNSNGLPDRVDIFNGTSIDCDNDDIPDECESDCNANGQADACDILFGVSKDCTCNGIPDECEPDCNANGIADSCDIAAGRSQDCTYNGVPDECEPDCNHNGIADSCDIQRQLSPDCNHDGIPDSCDIAAGTSQDCSGNGVPDECDPDCNGNKVPDQCDILSGFSEDIDADGVPDECESWSHCVSDSEHFDYAPHRLNAVAEYLAMELTGQLRAPDEEYDRIDRDLGLLASQYPVLGNPIPAYRYAQNELLVALFDANLRSCFDQLNDFYQVVSVQKITADPIYLITFCDNLHPPAIAETYSLGADVRYAEPDYYYTIFGSGLDSATVSLESVEGTTYVYKFSYNDQFCGYQVWQFRVDDKGAFTLDYYGAGPCECNLPNKGDFDSDGIIDCLDPCPGIPESVSFDSDNDGVGDSCDQCPNTVPGSIVYADGCSLYRGDFDRDGDIALDDWAGFQFCMTGPGTDATLSCRSAQIDDFDVDLRDYAYFVNCFSGTGNPASPFCR